MVLISNDFSTADCTGNTEKKPKELHGRMMDERQGLTAPGLLSPVDGESLWFPSIK